MDPILARKQALRRQVLPLLGQLAEAGRRELSRQARERLVQTTDWTSARTVLLFAPMPEELDVWPLVAAALEAGKEVALPRFEGTQKGYGACWVAQPQREVVVGYYGIREPAEHCPRAPLNRLDFALIPGVAFDPLGHRLGRGKGYYDRFLAGFTGRKCGVAFEEQIVPDVPLAPHDVGVDCILTPSRWIVV